MATMHLTRQTFRRARRGVCSRLQSQASSFALTLNRLSKAASFAPALSRPPVLHDVDVADRRPMPARCIEGIYLAGRRVLRCEESEEPWIQHALDAVR